MKTIIRAVWTCAFLSTVALGGTTSANLDDPQPAPPGAVDIPGDLGYGTFDGTTYTLNQDIPDGVEITADNITLDGAGFKIGAPGLSQTITIDGRTSVTVKNVTAEADVRILSIVGSTDIRIMDNILQQDCEESIYLFDVHSSTISDNTIDISQGHGYVEIFSSGNILERNTITGTSTDIGVALVFSSSIDGIYRDNIIEGVNWTIYSPGLVGTDPENGLNPNKVINLTFYNNTFQNNHTLITLVQRIDFSTFYNNNIINIDTFGFVARKA